MLQTVTLRNALPAIRARFSSGHPGSSDASSFAVAASLDERARQPDLTSLSVDVTARVEIVPPSPHPHPLLPTAALRTPERVPIYFYALCNAAQPEVRPGPEVTDTRVIFFIHGGGNIVGHPTLELYVQFYIQLLRTVAAKVGEARQRVLIAPSYRLATIPENAFPAALQDLVAAYDHVLGKGYKASNIVIAGDSAGGNHGHQIDYHPEASAIQGHEHLGEQAKTQPSAIDLSTTKSPSSLYVGDSGVPPLDPLISGAFVPFTASWPKTLILVSSADQLIDASREVEKRLTALDRPVELVEYDERPHGWWVRPTIFGDDIQDAAQRVARFVLD